MSIVRINALEIPPQAGPEVAKRFAARAGSLEDVAGFEGFELLRPTGEAETRWFVYTRWADEASYDAWRDGDGARNSHAAQEGETAPQSPLSTGATLLAFDVEVQAGPSGVSSAS